MLGAQLYITPKNLIHKVNPVLNGEESAFVKKPARGTGLWTSTWRDETQDSGWVEWCASENFRDPYNSHWFLLQPNADVNLYTIDSIEDLRKLLDAYEWYSWKYKKYRSLGTSIDFERLSLEYDGIHLTEGGECCYSPPQSDGLERVGL